MAFKLFDRVQEASTTTGTGDVTVAGAVTGFQTFSSRYSTGDTLYYAIQDVDASGVPSGAWEVGLGTYSAANTLTRTTVMASSNSDALVSFAAGTKRVFVTMTALQGKSIREKVESARTYYVRTDGSDSNDGLANTSGGAWLTIQKAVDVVAATLDIAAGITVTIQVADGTYTGAVVMRTCVGAGSVLIQGNTTTPANCLISTTSATGLVNSTTTPVTISGFKMTATTSGNCLHAGNGGRINFSYMDFGACTGTYSAHLYADTTSSINGGSNYTISGGAFAHIWTNYAASANISFRTITITGTPAFSGAFMYSRSGLAYLDGNTYSGSATGVRYNLTLNAAVYSGGTTLPGNSAGTIATGGQYA